MGVIAIKNMATVAIKQAKFLPVKLSQPQTIHGKK
jgi:hypothetical protein